MAKIPRRARRYAYKMRHKYRQDPFAFLVLWALFFSAVFLIFAFRGLIATIFMKKIDVGIPISEESTEVEESGVAQEEGPQDTNDGEEASSDSDVVASGETYTVQSGDTLYGIAIELDKDWGEIAELNGIEAPYDLSVGQVLELP